MPTSANNTTGLPEDYEKDLQVLRDLSAKLRDGREEDKATVDKWTEALKRCLIAARLYEHPVIQVVVEKYQHHVDTINSKLQNDRELSEESRKLLFIERDMIEEFMGVFRTAEQERATIVKNAQAQIKYLKEQGI